jgi:UDP-glucose 4-epimerase
LFVTKILYERAIKTQKSIDQVVNVYYPEPITILDLAKIVQKTIIRETQNKLKPTIEIVDTNQPMMFAEDDKSTIKVDIGKVKSFLGINTLISPAESVSNLIKEKLQAS